MVKLVKSKHYRVPYMGSKQSIAERLIQAIHSERPDADTFIDLFGGGGAMTCHALDCGYKVIYNEINKDIGVLLKQCITTDWLSDYDNRIWQFVSRDEYNKIRDEFKPKTDEDIAYRTAVLICYSFGNRMETYLCCDWREEIKKNGHNFIIHADRGGAEFFAERYKDTLGYLYFDMLDLFKGNDDRKWRRGIYVNATLKIEAIAVACRWNSKFFELYKNYNLQDMLDISNKKIVNDINEHCPDIPKKQHYLSVKDEKLKELKQLQGLERLEQLEQLKQLQGLEQLEQLKHPQRLEQLEQLEQLEKLQQLKHLQGLEHLEQLQELQQIQRLEQLQRLQELQGLEQLKHLEKLQELQGLEQLQRLEKLQELEQSRLTFFNLDYRECFDVIKDRLDKDRTIIFLDPPYESTMEYNTRSGIAPFNHVEFKAWLKQLQKDGWKVFLSEYTNYDNYKELLTIQVKNKMAMGNVASENTRVFKQEKLFYLGDKKEKIKIVEEPYFDFGADFTWAEA